MNWRAIQHEGHRVVMGLLLHPQPGYPFTLALEIEYALSADGLSVRTSARNAGSRALPYGTGHHPYLTVGTEHIDAALLRIPARSVLEVDQRLIPTGRMPAVDGTKFDFRVPRPVGETKLDTAYADPLPDADGKTRIEMAAASGSPRVTVWMDAAYQYVMAFTGDTIDDVARRRKGLGIEPMTCPPNAFQTGAGLQVLGPGDTVTSAWGLTPVAGAGSRYSVEEGTRPACQL